MTKPIEPTSPESIRGPRGVSNTDPEKFKQIEEILKAGEAELDQQRKRSSHKTPEDDEEEPKAKSPGPLEADFYRTEIPSAPVGFAELEANALPSSEPEPQTPLEMAPPEQLIIEPELPESEDFWEDADLPDQPPRPTQLQESPQKESKVEFGKQEIPEKKKELPRTGVNVHQKIGKFAEEEKKTSTVGEFPLKGSPSKAKKISSRIPGKPIEEKPSTSTPWQPISKEKEITVPISEEGLEEPRITELVEDKKATRAKSQEKMRSQKGLKEPKTEEIAASSLREKEANKKRASEAVVARPPDPLPPECQKLAQTIQTASSPFLNPETSALFFQMVGTIAYMENAKPGISVTEVMLNSPAFQNSPFFNTTIRIEKYASAPDSFNIRLTGTPEAIRVFNNNIESLANAFTAAYEDRRITFRVGRLETALAPERHIIRRKKESGGKEDL